MRKACFSSRQSLEWHEDCHRGVPLVWPHEEACGGRPLPLKCGCRQQAGWESRGVAAHVGGSGSAVA